MVRGQHTTRDGEERSKGRQRTADEVEGERGDVLPDGRVGAGADVRVDAYHLQLVHGHHGLHLREQLVPDAERRGGPAHVRLARAARAHARVEAQPDLLLWGVGGGWLMWM